MKETIILTNFEFSSTIIGKVSHLSGGFSGNLLSARSLLSHKGASHRRCCARRAMRATGDGPCAHGNRPGNISG